MSPFVFRGSRKTKGPCHVFRQSCCDDQFSLCFSGNEYLGLELLKVNATGTPICYNLLLKVAIYCWFTNKKWWFSIVNGDFP
jgi:hypothetical protein